MHANAFTGSCWRSGLGSFVLRPNIVRATTIFESNRLISHICIYQLSLDLLSSYNSSRLTFIGKIFFLCSYWVFWKEKRKKNCWIFHSSPSCVVIGVVELCIVLVRNCMFYTENRSLDLVNTFFISNRYHHVHLFKHEISKKIDHFGDAS